MPLAVFPKCFLDDLCVNHTMSVERWVDLASGLGVDGLEFYWGFTPWEDDRELARVREYVESKGLAIPMMCYSPDFIKLDVSDRATEVEQAKKAIRATALLGGKTCRVLSGQRHPGVGRLEGVAMAAECIAELLPTAEEHGVVLVLENHYKDGFWEYPEFAQKMDVFLELLAAIPESPWFGVNYDPSNTIIAGEDPIALLEAVKHRVASMHASDRFFEGGTLDDLQKIEAHPMQGYSSILRHGVIGHGLNDFDKIFSILSSVGFNGWISVEDGQDPVAGMEHLRLSVEFLRRKMGEYGLN